MQACDFGMCETKKEGHKFNSSLGYEDFIKKKRGGRKITTHIIGENNKPKHLRGKARK